jgi:hypothetical protein
MLLNNEIISMYLESRIRYMDIFIQNPDWSSKAIYKSLPVLKLDYVMDQEGLAETNHINSLLEQYREREEKMLQMFEANKLVGKRVVKKSRKPFKSGNVTGVVKGVVLHPYKPGWNLAFSFEEDDAVVSVEQVKGFSNFIIHCDSYKVSHFKPYTPEQMEAIGAS